jgi:hypothetical protein
MARAGQPEKRATSKTSPTKKRHRGRGPRVQEDIYYTKAAVRSDFSAGALKLLDKWGSPKASERTRPTGLPPEKQARLEKEIYDRLRLVYTGQRTREFAVAIAVVTGVLPTLPPPGAPKTDSNN